nr:MAG TPA: Cytosine specific methyltransferase [Caudoviricetes sp.]
MERAGHKCIGYCEIDKYARASYQAIHDTEGEIDYKDITEVTDEEFRKLRGKVDIICGGFPCQAFSIAGKQLGFEDTRGTLFYEIARATEQIKPRYLFLENVRNLLSHDKGKAFERMLKILDELGYDAEWQMLNSKNFGVPQNRERVFIIAHLRGERTYRVFPIRGENKEFNTNGEINQVGNIGKSDNFGGNPQVTRVYDVNGISPTLNTMQGGGREPKILLDNKIRKLTPRECWRLQGFPDWAFDKAQELNSNSQLYKQAGNSVTVNVIEEIAKRIK